MQIDYLSKSMIWTMNQYTRFNGFLGKLNGNLRKISEKHILYWYLPRVKLLNYNNFNESILEVFSMHYLKIKFMYLYHKIKLKHA